MKVKKENPLATEKFVNHVAGMLSSYLWLGDIDNLKFYMNLLKESLDVNKNLWLTIPEHHKKRIKFIGQNLKAGVIPSPWSGVKLPEPENEIVKAISIGDWDDEEEEFDKIKREKDLQKLLTMTRESIEHITGDSGKLRISSETNVKYGRVDIKAQGEKICHVIELKLKEADHKIVGQVMKYMRAAGSKLHYELYEDIQGITVAESYSESATLDLKSMGVKMFTYSVLKDKLVLKPL